MENEVLIRRVKIESMQIEDLEDVLEIEEDSFTSPWNREQFLIEILYKKYSYFFTAKLEDTNKVLGYIGFWVIADTVYITNLAVASNFRRKGIGSLLLKEVEKFSKQRHISSITLEVRKKNYSAINLYKKFGFCVVGVRKNYYSDSQEDALIMTKSIEARVLPSHKK